MRRESSEGHQPADRPPLRAEEIDGAAPRPAHVHVGRRHGATVLVQERQVGAERRQHSTGEPKNRRAEILAVRRERRTRRDGASPSEWVGMKRRTRDSDHPRVGQWALVPNQPPIGSPSRGPPTTKPRRSGASLEWARLGSNQRPLACEVCDGCCRLLPSAAICLGNGESGLSHCHLLPSAVICRFHSTFTNGILGQRCRKRTWNSSAEDLPPSSVAM